MPREPGEPDRDAEQRAALPARELACAERQQHDGGRETNLSVVAAIGELEGVEHDLEAELRASSFVLRAKHSFSDFELGLTGGFVRYDAMFGVDAVWDLAVADVYAEVVATRLTADSLTTPQVSDQRMPAISAVMGLSYKPSPTVLIKPEVFFNGFGSFYARDYFAVATSERVGIGELTALGKLYLAATSNWEATPLTNVFSGIISNLNDPSALLTLGVRRSLADNVELIAGCYAPIGLLPDMSRLEARSEYGMYPHFFFTELKGTL